jgi:hypothetical protein
MKGLHSAAVHFGSDSGWIAPSGDVCSYAEAHGHAVLGSLTQGSARTSAAGRSLLAVLGAAARELVGRAGRTGQQFCRCGWADPLSDRIQIPGSVGPPAAFRLHPSAPSGIPGGAVTAPPPLTGSRKVWSRFRWGSEPARSPYPANSAQVRSLHLSPPQPARACSLGLARWCLLARARLRSALGRD